MDDFGKELTLEMIPEGLYLKIANAIGVESFYKLTEAIGGSTVYIPKPDALTRPIRDAHIKADFNGWNHIELARKYDVTERWVRQLCGPKNIEGQLDFFSMKNSES